LEAKILNTQKVAITVPKNIIIMIDRISKSKGISRSKLISSMLEQKLSEEKYAYLRNAYDRVFDDDSIKEEQRSTAMWLENQGNEGGQEW
jgi:metal-responsive CopG/Arc/MetJ family transcriptional regulator